MFTGIATWIAKSVIGGWLTKIGAAIAWLFKAWYRIAIAVLLGVCIWLYVGKASEARRADKMTTVAAKWESAYVLVIEAQRLAKIAQVAMNDARTAKETSIAKGIDNDTTTRETIASRAAAYASLRTQDGYCERAANPATENSVAEGDNRSGETTVLLTRPDFDALNAIAARMVLVKAWGDKAIQEGVAVPVE